MRVGRQSEVTHCRSGGGTVQVAQLGFRDAERQSLFLFIFLIYFPWGHGNLTVVCSCLQCITCEDPNSMLL